ncbi:transposable element Tc1 transposase [Trichonephila clavipes]|nr:transposable element Tc1 transposase [Trichonephila clavipes]
MRHLERREQGKTWLNYQLSYYHSIQYGRKPIEMPAHCVARLQWCLARSGLNHANRGRIKLSDESRFKLCPNDCRRRVWRPPEISTDPAFTITHHTGSQLGVMVRGAISFHSLTPLVVIRVTLTAQWRLHLSVNVDDLARLLEQIWQEIPHEIIRGLYLFMPRRVAASIQARGGPTPY